MTIPFFVQSVSEEMKNAAMDALQNENFVGVESVIKFEEDFARYIGTKHAIAVSSGNSALHLSLLALGISSNSKVVTPTNSFIASANCIKMTSKISVFRDLFQHHSREQFGRPSAPSFHLAPFWLPFACHLDSFWLWHPQLGAAYIRCSFF